MSNLKFRPDWEKVIIPVVDLFFIKTLPPRLPGCLLRCEIGSRQILM